jgi:DNA-binding Lrp family transcriptional regulator
MLPLDRTSFDILRLLTKDARLSNKELAAAVGLAPSSCHERLKQLRACGLLRGAHADVDLRQLGLGLEAILQVELKKHSRGVVGAFLKRLSKALEVRQAFIVTGAFDVFAHVAIRDMGHLRDVVDAHFTSDKDVARIETCVVYSSWSAPGRLPVVFPGESR